MKIESWTGQGEPGDGGMSDRDAMLARRAELVAAHPEITIAGELAPLMGEHEPEYWRWQIEGYFEKELAEESDG